MNLPRHFLLLPLVVALAGCSAGFLRADPGFGAWPAGASPQEIGDRVAARYLAGKFRLLAKDRVMHYAETCTWYGALTFAKASHDEALTARLVARFQPLFGESARLVPPPQNVDYSVFGALPLALFIETKDVRYEKIGLALADQQWILPQDGSLIGAEGRAAAAQGLSWQTRYWIDDMYMITMLQTQAYRATQDRSYIDRAAREAVVYLRRLQQPNGLFFHAPDVPFFWGRGNGWFAAGMSELLLSLPPDHPDRPEILASYRKMMAGLLRCQAADGMWRQLIDDPQSWTESSCTGMFTYAFITGVKHGWLDAAVYGPAARKGWLALVAHLSPEAAMRDVCEGTNKQNDRQYYLDRLRLTGDLHGQAPVLWCAAALLP